MNRSSDSDLSRGSPGKHGAGQPAWSSTCLGLPVAMGMGVGTALGVALKNYAVGFGLGVALALSFAVVSRRR